VEVQGLTDVVAIAAGGAFSLAVRSDGTVWAWGDNSHGELGVGTVVDSNVPVQVHTLTGVIAIAAGQDHALALTSAGKVYAWGLGSDGQVGDGLFSSSASPVAVTGLSSGVTAIAAGADHSLALLSGGTVDAWGDDSNGQLGNASTTNVDTPVAVGGLGGVQQISAGSLYSLAVTGSGQAYAWGQNNDGQLGIGSTADAHIPTLMTTVGNGAQALGSGSDGDHTLLIAQPYATLIPATGPIAFTAPGPGSFRWSSGRRRSPARTGMSL
jgi:alpha-tubulin suppressor-like RCC1 family protein